MIGVDTRGVKALGRGARNWQGNVNVTLQKVLVVNHISSASQMNNTYKHSTKKQSLYNFLLVRPQVSVNVVMGRESRIRHAPPKP